MLENLCHSVAKVHGKSKINFGHLTVHFQQKQMKFLFIVFSINLNYSQSHKYLLIYEEFTPL